MHERLASVAGLFLAILIVVAVMNAPVLGEILDEIRGAPIVSRAPSYATPTGGSGGGPSHEIGGGSGSSGERAGGGGGSGTGQGGTASFATSFSDGTSWSGAAVLDHGAIARPASREAAAFRAAGGDGPGGAGGGAGRGGRRHAPDGGAEQELSADAGDGQEEEGPGVEQAARLPAATAKRPIALAVVRCDGERPSLWLARMSQPAVAIPLGAGLPARLGRELADEGTRPSALHVVSHGCSTALLDGLRHQLSRLCASDLVGLPVVDLDSRRQLPMCGL